MSRRGDINVYPEASVGIMAGMWGYMKVDE
jgi:hypothetical protein